MTPSSMPFSPPPIGPLPWLATCVDTEFAAGDSVLDVLLAGQAMTRCLMARYTRLRAQGPSADPLRAGLARRLCAELAVQLQIEEELFYPELRQVLIDSAPVDQAEVEHECMRELSTRLMDMAPDDPMFDARVMVLGELLELHLAREAQQIYPMALRAPLDFSALGLALVQRRDELLADIADSAGGERLENESADPVGEPPR
ncbi:hemerythrin domain-containing protein [Aquincola sp. S2]|uniref:Hemerythrin domain-containing protein n=1 Tax=Pseudaquabacterium terrae TaxID=2732868 RepID=A0ABX2EHK3_9BURK|nr:hemerythrin domain-containing protein [Aquabacterium terrae]NRF68130.1 hemerythrin domain-containing protein [Aquabacterium terrae]